MKTRQKFSESSFSELENDIIKLMQGKGKNSLRHPFKDRHPEIPYTWYPKVISSTWEMRKDTKGHLFYLRYVGGAGGKYGKIAFLRVYERLSKGHNNFAVKITEGIDEYDRKEMVVIEAQVLEELGKKKDKLINVPQYLGHLGHILLLRFVAGDVIETAISRKGLVLDYNDMVTLVDSMLAVDFALNDIIENDAHMKEFLTQRRIRLLKHDAPDLGDNFYSYRVIQAGRLSDDFKEVYMSNNNTLKNARKMWIGWDHTENRILLRYGRWLNNARYDFNHIAYEFIGIDLAMLSGAFGTFSEDTEMNNQLINLANLVVLEQYKKNAISDNLSGKVATRIEELRNYPTDKVGINDFYEDRQILADSASMYAAFLHRGILDMFRAAKKYKSKGEETSKEKSYRYLSALAHICQSSKHFLESLTIEQRDFLQKEGYRLVTEISPLQTHLEPALMRLVG